MNEVRFLRITPDGVLSVLEQPLDYDEVCAMIGFPINAHLIAGGRAYMYLAAEGMKRGAEFNPFATSLAKFGEGNFATGTALIVGATSPSGGESNVPLDIEEWVRTSHQQWQAERGKVRS